MADALKDMFNKKFFERLAQEFNKADKNFHPEKFVKDVMSGLEPLSLNQRMRQTTVILKKHLPADYSKAVGVMSDVIPKFSSHYTSLLFPDFVGQFGHEHTSLSLDRLKYFTQFGSSEFAIREYLKRDFKGTIKVMNKWAEDKNYHVRRLASEGCRPRLPWSFNLEPVMKDPETTRPILEKLNADKELYVKKSVANHMNDFSHLHPDWMLKVIAKWDQKNEHTAWIVKHASRTLIKKGDARSLAIFAFEKDPKIELANFKLKNPKIKLGEKLEWSFEIESKKKTAQKLAVDYAVHYMKSSGETSRKVFKLKELELKPGKTEKITKAQLFKDFTTRKHYAGKHVLELIVNGKSYGKKEFNLSLK